MPRASVWMLRTALLYLAAGFTVGALVLWQKGTGTVPAAWRLLGLHIELVLVGWTLLLALGVAYWILPRRRIDGRPVRGREGLAWLAYGLLNAGVWLVILASMVPPAPAPAFLVAGRFAEAAAVLAFAVHAWPRVRAAGRTGRAEPG